MFIMFFIFCMVLFICLMVMMLTTLLSKKMIIDREKNSPFECGFEPFNSSRLPFSLHFFLIAIIFLIFDVEIALMMPMIISMKTNNLMIWVYSVMIFIIILLMGIYHEWNQGALEWSK